MLGPEVFMQITAAVAGAGPRGLEHASVLGSMPEVVLAGLADPNPEARARAEVQCRVPTWADAVVMVRETRPALLVLATPPMSRPAAWVASLLEAGEGCVKVLLVEKPVAQSWEDAASLVDLCERLGVKLTGGFQLRCSPEFAMLREAVARGAVGTIQSVEATCFGNFFDQGSHLLDLVDWIEGSGIAWIEMTGSDDLVALAARQPLRPDWREDMNHPAPLWCEGRIGLGSGAVVGWASGLLAPQPVPALGPWLQKRVRVIGSLGAAEAHVGCAFRLFDAASHVSDERRFGPADFAAATAAMHARLVGSLIRPGEPCPLPSGRELLRVMGALEGGFASVLANGARQMPASPTAPGVSMHRWRERRELERVARLQVLARRLESIRPAVSIIISLEDHRGMAPEAVASWIAQRSVEPESYEILLITNPRTAVLGESVRGQLRSWDRLLHTDCGPWEDMREYQTAADGARGHWLFLTEPHCIAEPKAVARMQQRFATADEDGFFCRSEPICRSAIADMETRYFESGLRDWCQPGDWRKVVLRGFAIRKDAFHAVGGFRFQFLRFSEWLLAANLKRQGYRLGYAPEVGVGHRYSDGLRTLDEFILIFTMGECLYRLEKEQPGDELFFPTPPEWADNLIGDRAVWLSAAQLLARGMLSGTVPLAAIDELARFVAVGSMGLRAAEWGWRLRVARHKAAVHFWKLLGRWDRCYHAFVRYYEDATSAARVRFLLQHVLPVRRPVEKRSKYLPESMGDGELLGWHGSEQHGGADFRWTGWYAAVRVFPPDTSRRLVIRAHPFLPTSAEASGSVAVFIGNRRLRPRARKGRSLEFEVPPDALRKGPQWLSIVARPFHAAGDVRRLGLPVSRISFHRG